MVQPFDVLEKKNCVNYRIRSVDGSCRDRIVHFNVLKRCVGREAVRRLVVVAESGEITCGSRVKLNQRHNELSEGEIGKIKEELVDVLRDEQGDTKSAVIQIEVKDARPIHQYP